MSVARADIRGVTRDRTLDELRVAAFERAWNQKRNGRMPVAAVEEFLSSWRVAPLVAYAVEMEQAVDALPVLERMVAERTRALETEVLLARRRTVLAEAKSAALEVLA